MNERFDRVEQLALLVRFAEIVVHAELDGARSMLFAHFAR